MAIDDRREWLEADGVGGFASGTASGVRTRRYHALLLTATIPPTGRMVLVNGLDAWVTTAAGRFAVSSQRYQPDVLHPDGYLRIASFTTEPWPTWILETSDGVRLAHEIVVQHAGAATVVTWRLLHATGPVNLEVRPFLSGRDYHSMHRENRAFRLEPERDGGTALIWRPYDGVPAIRVKANATYTHDPAWYRDFLYVSERDRGLDDTEDLASPGMFTWCLDPSTDEAVLILSASCSTSAPSDERSAVGRARAILSEERERRSSFSSLLHRAADAYIVQRGRGKSIVAGYPWFTDWGRDTFIAIRGLCLATGRLADALDILLEWSHAVSEGMLPNRFADSGEAPEFNAVDASLWFVIAVHDLLARASERRHPISETDARRLRGAVQAILQGYTRGTRFGIRADGDGLLTAGADGIQLTWMDARVGDRVITPRIGKPVEVQALWLNALWIGSQADPRWSSLLEVGRRSLPTVFGTNSEAVCTMSWTSITCPVRLTRPCARTRCWPSADCRWQ